MKPDSSSASHPSSFVLDRLPKQMRYKLVATVNLAKDPIPETLHPSPQAADTLAAKIGYLPVLAFISSLGVLSMAYASYLGRVDMPQKDLFYWLSFLLVFVPIVFRLLSTSASRFERMSLLCMAGVFLYLIVLTLSPTYFVSFDSFSHWRTAQDIAVSKHLFSDNALLPVSPFYPGLEIVTNAFSTISGLDIFPASMILMSLTRFVMLLALYLFYECILQSARAAGLATIIYMTNPHFIFFDTNFSYESLALPLALFALLMVTLNDQFTVGRSSLIIAAWIALVAITATHHMTDFVLDGLLILWVLVHTFQHRFFTLKSHLTGTALLGVILSTIFVIGIGKPVVQYLSSYFSTAILELIRIITGSEGTRQLFVSYADQTTPIWMRLVSATSIVFILSALPLGLLCVWQRYRHYTIIMMLSIFSVSFPLSQIFRFTNFGSEITDRSAAFSFLSLGCILGIFLVQFFPIRSWNRKRLFSLTAVLTVIFVGGIIIGAGPPSGHLPGHYIVAGDERSIEPEGMEAAMWTSTHIGSNQRMATDRVNQVLMSTYGHQRITNTLKDGIDTTFLFFSSEFGKEEQAVTKTSRIHYLVVDHRLSQQLPDVGFYFDPGEYQAFEHKDPITLQSLTKFDAITQINKVFDSGDIAIYDTGGISNATEKH